MKIEVTPSSPTKIGVNHFRTSPSPSPTASPIMSRRSPSPGTGGAMNTLDIQVSISKTKSLVRINNYYL